MPSRRPPRRGAASVPASEFGSWPLLAARFAVVVVLGEVAAVNDEFDAKRTLSQNAKMWPMLTDISRQVDWPHTNKAGEWRIAKMPPMAWKAVLTAAFEKETAMAQGWDGGTVMVGASTSNYGIRKMAEFIEFLYAAGSAKDVQWSEKSEEIRRQYGTESLRRAA